MVQFRIPRTDFLNSIHKALVMKVTTNNGRLPLISALFRCLIIFTNVIINVDSNNGRVLDTMKYYITWDY